MTEKILEQYGIASHSMHKNSNLTVDIWGSGNVKREFLHVTDMVLASLFVLRLEKKVYEENTKPMLSHINVGTGKDITIRKLVEMLKEITNFNGEIVFNRSKPDGPKRKLIDVSRIENMGWSYSMDLNQGLRATYDSYLAELEKQNISSL